MAVADKDLAKYLRLPPDDGESVAPYLAAAKSSARTAGVPDFKNNAQYDMFILSLAAMYYENRGMAFSGSYQATAEANATRMCNAFILELRHATEDTDTSEGGGDP